MYNVDLDAKELCLIDAGIKSLQNVPVRPHLQSLNLHSNFIRKLENLNHLGYLKHLDLSSNQISGIEGLEGLVSLRTLNLSCNLLVDVRGLAGLRSLVKLNLSYNKIEDISGFRSVSGSDYRLTYLELHGNKLSSCQHVIQNLSRCVNLRHLTLCQSDTGNPLCSMTGYRSQIFSGLPQIEYLDNTGRDGRTADMSEVLADIPGLEEYMDYLLSNSNSVSSDMNICNIITPKIDKALEQFKQRAVAGSDTSTADEQQYELSTMNSARNDVESSQESRIHALENQIAQLLQASKAAAEQPSSAGVTRLPAKRDVDQTDESDLDVERSSGDQTKPETKRKSRKSKIPGYRRSTSASRARKDQQKSSENASTGTPDPSSDDVRKMTKMPSAYSVDEHKQRDDIQSTYVQLMGELEQERERRWKSEQASKKLVNHIKELQDKARTNDQFKDTAIEATTKLKHALTNEREAKIRFQDDVDSLKDQVKELSRQLSAAKETEESYKRSLQSLEEMAAKMQREKLQEITHEQKKTQDAQLRASALHREVEMLRNSSDKQKSQVQQLQELLANREQQHREELKSRYTLNSKELKDVLEDEVKKAQREYAMETKTQQEKIDQLTKQYTELEDEFRMALQIEASRFKEVQDAYQVVSEENAENKQALIAAQRKDEKSSSMISELTSLVKEQKGRISELSKSKQEQNIEYRERIQTLEAHTEEARKRMLQLELLKQDKTKLLAQVEAQDSVIQGLKAERKLWGQELAQQGASLAQDRGRLESKIESLTSEVSTVKKQLERETDALKIKTKMLEDQTETIRKLKEAVLERDEEVKKTRDEALKIQKNLEEQLIEERGSVQDVQDTLERLRERKIELKQQVSDLQSELQESKKAHSILNTKWKEKSQFIGDLEKQVQQMKDTWEAKEIKLTNERDKSLQAAHVAVEKLKSIDDAFRKQLDTKEQSHQEELSRLEQEKQLELEQANQRQKKTQDAQLRASALHREVEMLRNSSDKQKSQVLQLQELLANREQQHREELKSRYTLNSKELKDVLEDEVKKAQREYAMETKTQQEKIDQLTKQYTELEDEFRMALQIEASRFKEVQDAYQVVSEENAENKQALIAAQRKDEKSSSMISELTSLVKEQKGRISELSKSKQEQNVEYRERIQTLEAHTEEARKRMLQLELLKQDKTKLLAQVEAQDSVIQGLKAERKLWGQELAQQGASLAQDRGRLESKIESLTSEVSTVKKQLERETDALKIKTKMLEDQTETIRKLKEAVLERDEEVKKTRDEALKIQKNLEEQLIEERGSVQDVQDTLERLRERKIELKQQVSDLQSELQESKKAHSILNTKWKEKSQFIGDLEKQVQQMKDTWEAKEIKLTNERDKSLQAAHVAVEKLKSIDDAFRKQLDTKEQSHQEELSRLEQEKQLELEQANQRLYAVEEEMRELLQENQTNKKLMEDKVKRLTRAMNELQSDLL